MLSYIYIYTHWTKAPSKTRKGQELKNGASKEGPSTMLTKSLMHERMALIKLQDSAAVRHTYGRLSNPDSADAKGPATYHIIVRMTAIAK